MNKANNKNFRMIKLYQPKVYNIFLKKCREENSSATRKINEYIEKSVNGQATII